AACGQAVAISTVGTGNEFTRRHRLSPFRDHLLELRNGAGNLDDAYFVSRVEAAANEVHMGVDEARNHRRSPQVDRLRTRPDRVGITPEFGDAAIADRDRRNDA